MFEERSDESHNPNRVAGDDRHVRGLLRSPDKDESGKGRWRGGYDRYQDHYGYQDDRKVKFRTSDGCEVERKWKKGEYEE